MNAADFRFGFRVVGKTCEPRRLVTAGAAFAAYAACDPKAEVNREAYLSAFQYREEFRRHLEETGSTAGYSGPCWSPWLWWDIDAEELQYSHKDAGALAAFLVEHYGTDPGELLLFFSGSKGFHVGLPTSLWSPAPSVAFAKTARRFAEHVAELAAVTVDAGVYDVVRCFRAPNSKHPKTGRHKIRLTLDELIGPLDAILELAKAPAPFAVPTMTRTNEQAAADWQAAADLAASEAEVKAARRATGTGSPMLNKATLDYIRNGADQGDRHRLLFSAAANLGEFACPASLAFALLEESGLDSGLPPKDVRRQIDCGLSAAVPASPPEPTQQIALESTQTASDGSTVKEPPEAATIDAGGFNWQTGQQATGATESAPAAALQADLARLWEATPAPKADQGENTCGKFSTSDKGDSREAGLPPPLVPLPLGAVGSGPLDKPCRCGSTEYADFPISDGRTRRDCRKCKRFIGWGLWYDQGGQAT